MSERIRKTIYELEFKSTGDAELKATTQTLERVETQFDETKQAAKELGTTGGKTAKEVAAVGTASEKITNQVNGLGAKLTKAADNMSRLKTASALKGTFDQTTDALNRFNPQIEKFKRAMDNPESIDAVKSAMKEFVQSLPKEAQLEVGNKLDREFKKLNTTLESPVGRLKELQKILAQAALGEIDLPDEELRKLTKEAARLKDAIRDVKTKLSTLSDEKLSINAISEGVQGALGAFTAFEGAVALAGGSNEDLQKSILKVQGAMALLTGVQQLAKTLTKENAFLVGVETAARKVYNVVVGQSTGAMKAFRVAAALTGIGFLIIAIAALAANWDKVKGALSGVNPQLQKNVDLTAKAVEAGKLENELLQLKIEKYKLLGVSVSFLNDIELEGAKKRRDELKNQLDAVTELAAATKEAAKASGVKTRALGPFGGFGFVAQSVFGVNAKDVDKVNQGLNEITIAYQEANNNVLRLTGQFKDLQQDSLIDSLQFEIDKLDAAGIETINKRKQYWQHIRDSNSEGTKEWRQAVVNLIKIDAELRKKREEEQNKEEESLKKRREIIKKNYDKIIEDRKTFNDKLQDVLNKIDSANLNSLTGEDKTLAQAAANDEAITLLEDSLKAEIQALAVSGKEKIAIIDQVEAAIKQMRTKNELDAQKELTDGRDKASQELLSEAERHELAMASIKKKGEEEILKIQIAQAEKRLDALVAAGKGEELEAIRLQNNLIELRSQLTDSEDEDRKKRQEEIKAAVIDLYNVTASSIKTLLQLEISATDKIISLQQRRVDEARSIAEKGNAELLQLEQERLDELNKKREKFVRAQQAIIAVQLIAESSLAVVKAASQTGAGAPIAIAAVLIALVAGLAQARSVASQAAFFEGGPADWSRMGGYTGHGNIHGVSLGVGAKPYTYHNQEYIMPHQVTGLGNNRDWFEKIHHERIDIDSLLRSKDKVVVVPDDNSKLITAIENIPSLTLNLNSAGIISIVERRRKKNNRLLSRS